MSSFCVLILHSYKIGGITRAMSQGGNFAKRGPLATVKRSLANTRKKT